MKLFYCEVACYIVNGNVWKELFLISKAMLKTTRALYLYIHFPLSTKPSTCRGVRSLFAEGHSFLNLHIAVIQTSPSAYLRATVLNFQTSSTAYLRAKLSSISRLPSSTAYLRATSSSISRLTSSTAASPFFLSPATSTSTKIKTTISYTGILNIGVLVNIPLAHYSVEKFNVQ